MGVEPKIGGFYPPKWMVKIMENTLKWMIWGFWHHYFWKHPYQKWPSDAFQEVSKMTKFIEDHRPSARNVWVTGYRMERMEWVSVIDKMW